MIIEAFKNKIFPLNYPDDYYSSYSSEEDSQEIINSNKLNELLTKTEKELDASVIEKYFYSHSLKILYEHLKSSKKDTHDSIKTRFKTLEYDMKKITDNEIGEEKLDPLADLVKKILGTTEI